MTPPLPLLLSIQQQQLREKNQQQRTNDNEQADQVWHFKLCWTFYSTFDLSLVIVSHHKNFCTHFFFFSFFFFWWGEGGGFLNYCQLKKIDIRHLYYNLVTSEVDVLKSFAWDILYRLVWYNAMHITKTCNLIIKKNSKRESVSSNEPTPFRRLNWGPLFNISFKRQGGKQW